LVDHNNLKFKNQKSKIKEKIIYPELQNSNIDIVAVFDTAKI
jgi:hypothetical protein